MDTVYDPSMLQTENPTEETVSVKVLSVPDFLSTYLIEIPEYQRPYVWTEEKTTDLLKDLEEFFSTNTEGLHYYLGAILLHKEKDRFRIIDGQQRITTLLILDYILHTGNSFLERGGTGLSFSSPVSHRNILANKKIIEQWHPPAEYEFGKMAFSVVVTCSEDDAFTFFDSQNSRGVNLDAVDYLKAYHLRAIDNMPCKEKEQQENEREALQKRFATLWDRNNTGQKLDPLFSHILWRGRKWRGKQVGFESPEYILNEFQKGTMENKEKHIKLYSGRKNRLASSLVFSSKYGATLTMYPVTLHTRAREYPFSLRQPIEKGTGFFLYAEKYIEAENFLFYENQAEPEIKILQEFYDYIYRYHVSEYLTGFFRLCILTYYDNFESDKIMAFALWLDYLLGSYRIYQSSIVKQTTIRIIRDKPQNLLDVIHAAFTPEEVFGFIRSITNKEYYDDEIIIRGKGVRGIYKDRLLAFFTAKGITTGDDSLKNKKDWIEALITKQYGEAEN